MLDDVYSAKLDAAIGKRGIYDFETLPILVTLKLKLCKKAKILLWYPDLPNRPDSSN
jgi:hypothetical protein